MYICTYVLYICISYIYVCVLLPLMYSYMYTGRYRCVHIYIDAY